MGTQFKALARALMLGAALFAAPVTGAVAKENVQLSKAQGLALGNDALRQGNLKLAEDIARAILRAEPKDPGALILLGQVAQSVGKFEDAQGLYKKAFRSTKVKSQKYTAAVLTSKSLQAAEKPERAKLWLRRAVQFSTTDAQRANALRGFGEMRRQSPWRTSLSFGITPSNNVNNGSDATEICTIIFGTPLCSDSVSDTESVKGAFITGSLSTSYRLRESSKNRLLAGLDLYHRNTYIRKSERSKTTSRASDFNFSYVGARLNFDSVINDRTSTSEVFSIGQTFYGGSKLANKVSFTKGFTRRLNQRSNIGISFTAAREENDERPFQSFTQRAVSIPYNVALKNGTRLGFTLGYSDVDSNDLQTAHYARSLSVSVTPAQPIFNIRPTFSFSVNDRRDDEQASFPVRRKDQGYGLSASFSLPSIEVYGFVPVLVFEARKNKSNVSLYDTSSLSSRIEFRSAF